MLAVYLGVVAWIGFRAGRGQHSTRDHFLGSRAIPWWAAGISIIATETSALTFLGTPTQSLRGDWTFLQLAFGSAVGRLLVATLLVAAYYRADVYTVYGYLGKRFGPRSQVATSTLFFFGRTLGSGVRLYGAAIALVVVAGLSFPAAILLIAVLAVAYTLAGGLRSVVWTDVVQGALLVAGGLLALGYLIAGLPGGSLAGLLDNLGASQTASGGPKLKVLEWSLDPRQAYTLAAGLVGSAFLTMSTHGTDQDLMQRVLASPDARDGRRGLVLSAFLHIPVVVLFLLVGSALWVNLGGDAGAQAAAAEIAAEKGLSSTDKGFDFVFPVYILAALPAGARGLILAAVLAAAMSSLDSAIAALSSTAVKCIWQPYLAPGRSDAEYVSLGRKLSVGFGAMLVGVALVVWLSEGAGSEREGFGILMLGLKVLTWLFPPILGVVLVGTLTRRGRDAGNLLALALGVSVLLLLELWSQIFGRPAPLAWTWNPVLGCAVAFLVAALFPAARSAPARLAAAG